MSREALVVGINQYDHLLKLKAPAEDAEAIAQILNQQGEFQIRRLPEVVKDDLLQVGQTTQVALVELKQSLKNSSCCNIDVSQTAKTVTLDACLSRQKLRRQSGQL